MLDSEYKKFVDGMSKVFKSHQDITRVIVGESPYNDGGNLNNVSYYPYKQVAFLRSLPANGATKETVNRVWSLLFGDKVDSVKNLLQVIVDSTANATKEEYLAKYLAEEQNIYLINAFYADRETITDDLKKLNDNTECKKILVATREFPKFTTYISKNILYFIIHPSKTTRDIEQWKLDYQGDDRYNCSKDIIDIFRLKQK
ncbi:hypothetical protein KF282_0889 [Lactococcus lactis subsp. lactis]|jgi:hypothetical protein|uniref:Uncharacterized protein n=1 Tax=Lactococcus lactis subsp. lactis TaxID=1360 RepID=A0A0V8CZJ0_LACLL|nr:hypothetical protein [Lactococcus lactis]KSU06732.1 hypothetical protein KF282_0889 [Lactococcus lactis subsp. lactis]